MNCHSSELGGFADCASSWNRGFSPTASVSDTCRSRAFRGGGGSFPRGAAPRDYPNFQWRYERAFPSSRLPAPDGPPSRIHLACSMHAKLGVGEAGKGRMTILDARCGKAGPERVVKLDGTPARGLMASGDSVSRDTVSSRACLFCSEKRTRIVGDKLMPWRIRGCDRRMPHRPLAGSELYHSSC